MGITARKRHTFRVNKSSESRINCLNVSSQVWWWVLNDRARARDHARLRACVHGWVVCLRLVEFESRRQAALVATGRAPPCVVLQFCFYDATLVLLAAMPLGVSVRDGHVGVSAGFARLADSSSTACIRPPLLGGFPRRRSGVMVILSGHSIRTPALTRPRDLLTKQPSFHIPKHRYMRKKKKGGAAIVPASIFDIWRCISARGGLRCQTRTSSSGSR